MEKLIHTAFTVQTLHYVLAFFFGSLAYTVPYRFVQYDLEV